MRRQDVFVIHSLYGDAEQSPNDKLCRLLFFIGALKDAGAERVTAVVPYLCYARKDRRTQAARPDHDKIRGRLFEACGADAMITFDVHNLAAFEKPSAAPRQISKRSHCLSTISLGCCGDEQIAVVSPDIGGAKRAEQFRRALAAELHREPTAAFVEKRRSGGVVSGELLVGEVRDRAVVIFDDLISTGGTLLRAARRCREAGANGYLQRRRTACSWARHPPSSPIPCSRELQSPIPCASVAAAEGD